MSAPPTLSFLEQDEDRLFACQRMDSRGRLFAHFRHELNNSLGIAVGHLDLIQRAGDELGLCLSSGLGPGPGPGPKDERSILALKTIREGATAADRAIDRMSRLLARAGEIERADAGPVRVAEALEAVRELLHCRLKRHPIEVTAQAEAPPVAMPFGLLFQILLNLLSNAVDAVEERGPAGTQTAHRSLSIRHAASEGTQTIQIRDEGAGIPAERHARLFEPFFSTKPSAEGIGLALYVSRRIARRYSGELALVSSGPTGSVFELSLPSAN